MQAVSKRHFRLSGEFLEVDLPIDLDSKRYNNNESGSCYLAAFAVMFTLNRHCVAATLCHGVATCTGSHPGERMMHAWVEVELEAESEVALPKTLSVAIDAANPNRPTAILPVDIYYAIGKVKPTSIRRYSYSQMLQASVALDHVGPFQPALEPTVDDDECSFLPNEFQWLDVDCSDIESQLLRSIDE